MLLLKFAALALLLYALVVAAFETLGPVAAVPVGLGVLVAALPSGRQPATRLVHVTVRLRDGDRNA